MTRKHFEALALALAESNAHQGVVIAVADVCAKFNPGFRRTRFTDRIREHSERLHGTP